MTSPEQRISAELFLTDQANEVYDKILFNAAQLRIETSHVARTILSEVIDSYLDF